MKKIKEKVFRGLIFSSLISLFLLSSASILSAQGIDASIEHINQLMDDAVTSVNSGDPKSAKISLE